MVSHDCALLDGLTAATLRLSQGAVTAYPGAYGAARRLWEQETCAREEEGERARARVREAAGRLADARRDQASAERGLGAKHRMKDRHDHDARSMGAKVSASWAEARIGRDVGVRRTELARAEAAVPAFTRDATIGRSLFVDYARAPSARLAAIDAREVRAGERVVLGDVRLVLGRDDRVRVEGPNGAGKSTLIGALLASVRLPEERILHVPQDLSAEDERAAVDAIRALPARERGRTLSLVAALGVDPDCLLASARPSPGEARKARIALGLGRHAWLVVLDEPTNHLDSALHRADRGGPGGVPGRARPRDARRRARGRLHHHALAGGGGEGAGEVKAAPSHSFASAGFERTIRDRDACGHLPAPPVLLAPGETPFFSSRATARPTFLSSFTDVVLSINMTAASRVENVLSSPTGRRGAGRAIPRRSRRLAACHDD